MLIFSYGRISNISSDFVHYAICGANPWDSAGSAFD
jgi:hypothetical protein